MREASATSPELGPRRVTVDYSVYHVDGYVVDFGDAVGFNDSATGVDVLEVGIAFEAWTADDVKALPEDLNSDKKRTRPTRQRDRPVLIWIVRDPQAMQRRLRQKAPYQIDAIHHRCSNPPYKPIYLFFFHFIYSQFFEGKKQDYFISNFGAGNV
jgi:hypothetical protein